MTATFPLALDIETTGLDPVDSHIVAIGLAAPGVSGARIGDEPELLTWLERRIHSAPDETVLVTWNGEEFDFPFLRHRFLVRNIPTTLNLVSRGMVGKYGKPLYVASWGGHPHVDISMSLRATVEALGVSWSLKPTARAILEVEPVETDRQAIATLGADELGAYLRSDIEITLALAQFIGVGK